MACRQMIFQITMVLMFTLFLVFLPGCPPQDNSLAGSIQKAFLGCRQNEAGENGTEGESGETGTEGEDNNTPPDQDNFVPSGPTQHWKSKETIGNLRGNLGIYLDINVDEQGVFDGKIGNYVYVSYPGYGAYYAVYSDTKKGVCGKLDFSKGTGIVWPEGEDKTPVTVRLSQENQKLEVTFYEWPSLESDSPPGATLYKQ